MPEITVVLPSLAAPAGKSLFSRHYLATHLPRYAEWAEEPRPAFDRLAGLWARGQRLGATWNENQTETEFLRPALEVLGWTFIPQAAATRGGRLRRPDYALFGDAAARDEAYLLQGRDELGPAAQPPERGRPRAVGRQHQPQPSDGQLPGGHALAVGDSHQRPDLAALQP
jgi:hypothetical protein